MVIKEEFDIKYDSFEGVYRIVDEDGNTYGGDYLTYEDAKESIDSVTGHDKGIPIEEEPEPEEEVREYIVFRPYESRGIGYYMFARGGSIKNHVSYGIHETCGDFNDKSIALYTKDEAIKVARDYNRISREKGYSRHQNWRAMKKWW